MLQVEPLGRRTTTSRTCIHAPSPRRRASCRSGSAPTSPAPTSAVSHLRGGAVRRSGAWNLGDGRSRGQGATGIQVPVSVVRTGLGPGLRVKVTIRGAAYRFVASIGGRFMLPLSAEHRTAAGVAAGDEVEVDVGLRRRAAHHQGSARFRPGAGRCTARPSCRRPLLHHQRRWRHVDRGRQDARDSTAPHRQAVTELRAGSGACRRAILRPSRR